MLICVYMYNKVKQLLVQCNKAFRKPEVLLLDLDGLAVYLLIYADMGKTQVADGEAIEISEQALLFKFADRVLQSNK